jgi:hypothetical protein
MRRLEAANRINIQAEEEEEAEGIHSIYQKALDS